MLKSLLALFFFTQITFAAETESSLQTQVIYKGDRYTLADMLLSANPHITALLFQNMPVVKGVIENLDIKKTIGLAIDELDAELLTSLVSRNHRGKTLLHIIAERGEDGEDGEGDFYDFALLDKLLDVVQLYLGDEALKKFINKRRIFDVGTRAFFFRQKPLVTAMLHLNIKLISLLIEKYGAKLTSGDREDYYMNLGLRMLNVVNKSGDLR